MRCDAWKYSGYDRESGSKKNANELTKVITNFLSECEDPQRTWDLFKEYNNNATYLGLQSLHMSRLENTSAKYIVCKVTEGVKLEQVTIPLTLDRAKSVREEMRIISPADTRFLILQEIE